MIFWKSLWTKMDAFSSRTNINQDNLCLINIYAPNDQNQQVILFWQNHRSHSPNSTNIILLSGDFNCPLPEVDKVGGRDILHKKRTIRAIQELCNSFDLVDAWRTQHPNKKRYSWHYETEICENPMKITWKYHEHHFMANESCKIIFHDLICGHEIFVEKKVRGVSWPMN